jgi:uncharacterized protein
MFKAIFWIVICLGGLFATRILARKAVKYALEAQRVIDEQRAMDAQQASMQNRPKKTIPATEKMVRCDYCGLHLPSSESTRTENKVWCSIEHARLGVKQQV